MAFLSFNCNKSTTCKRLNEIDISASGLVPMDQQQSQNIFFDVAAVFPVMPVPQIAVLQLGLQQLNEPVLGYSFYFAYGHGVASSGLILARTVFPFSVIRYFWLLLRGLFGMVISMNPSVSAGTR